MTPAKRTSPWRLLVWWTLGLMSVSVVGLALIAVDLLTLNRDTAVLRSAMFAATGAHTKTTVQLDLGPVSFLLVRGVVALIPQAPPETRLALESVKRACVGVYQMPQRTNVRDGAGLMTRADEEMARRGWSRAIGVNQKDQTVLLYTPTTAADGDRLRVCVAVCDGNQIVVMSTEVEAERLQRLVAQQGGFKGGKLALR